MDLQQVYTYYKSLPRLELEVLLCHILNQTPTQLFLNPNQTLTKSQQEKLQSYIQRRLNNEPIAYIIGQKEFYGLNFFVNSKVLIPRPETEELVELALNLDPKPQTILDLGTGSGAIACSLATHLPKSQVTALDISHEALKIATKNAESLNLKNLTFLHSDFLTEISDNSHFDLIITNPPYVKSEDQAHMAKETMLYEPELALYAGEDGLNAYRQIFQQLKTKNISFKYLLGEFGFNQSEQFQALLKTNFSGKYTLLQDLAGITRFLKIIN